MLLVLLATLLVATVYCLLYVSEYGVLLLAIHIPKRLAAACYLLWSFLTKYKTCLLYTSPSPRDGLLSRMPSSA